MNTLPYSSEYFVNKIDLTFINPDDRNDAEEADSKMKVLWPGQHCLVYVNANLLDYLEVSCERFVFEFA